MTIDMEQVRQALADEVGGTITHIGVFPIQQWSQFDPDHDGIDSCTHYARLVVGDAGYEVPLESDASGNLHMAGWWEIDTTNPDLLGLPDWGMHHWATTGV